MGTSNSKDDDEDDRPRNARAPDIREADRLIIDATSLSCPTCFETFFKPPLVLPCGHSFCRACITRLVQRFTPGTQGFVTSRLIVCPLCQIRLWVPESVGSDPTAKWIRRNFAFDNILDGLRASAVQNEESIARTLEISDEAIVAIPTLQFENRRLREEMKEKDEKIRTLTKRVESMKEKFAQGKWIVGCVLLFVVLKYFSSVHV